MESPLGFLMLSGGMEKQACNFIKKETQVAQVFSCEFCEISKYSFFYRTPPGCFWMIINDLNLLLQITCIYFVTAFFLYAEASNPAKPKMKALLESKLFPPTNSRCVEFFYSMHGLGIGALRVYLVQENSVTDLLLWEKVGPQGEGWKNGKAHIASANSYKVINSNSSIFVFHLN